MAQESNSSNQDGKDEKPQQEPWWRSKISFLNVEGTVVFIMGVIVGIFISFILLLTYPTFFAQPITAISVRATVAAQTTMIPATPPDPSPASQNTTVDLVSIEEFPGELFSFTGLDGYGELNVIRNADEDLDYLFTYNMPQDTEGYAGIFFRFTPTRDLTEFSALQTTLSFGDEDALCIIYLEDHDGTQSYITLGRSGFINASDDAQMAIEGDKRIYTIPFANNFLAVPNRKSIEGIGVSVNKDVVNGEHACTIHEIDFLK